MKLVRCNLCGDMFALDWNERTCKCGDCKGLYLDKMNAIMDGPGIPLGFNNRSLHDALADRPIIGQGQEFTAFVIEEWCPTFLDVGLMRQILIGSSKFNEGNHSVKQTVLSFLLKFSLRLDSEGSKKFREYVGGLVDFCNGV